MTEATQLLQGSDKDFAVVHSTLTDSKTTAELLAEKTDRPLGSKYRIPLLGEARRIGHTLNTLDRIKARHDILVAALEQAEAALGVILLDENIKAWMAVNDPMAQQQAQRAFDALEAAKYKKTGYGLGTVLADAERAWSEDCQRS